MKKVFTYSAIVLLLAATACSKTQSVSLGESGISFAPASVETRALIEDEAGLQSVNFHVYDFLDGAGYIDESILYESGAWNYISGNTYSWKDGTHKFFGHTEDVGLFNETNNTLTVNRIITTDEASNKQWDILYSEIFTTTAAAWKATAGNTVDTPVALHMKHLFSAVSIMVKNCTDAAVSVSSLTPNIPNDGSAVIDFSGDAVDVQYTAPTVSTTEPFIANPIPSTAPLSIPVDGLMDGLKQEIATENGYMVVWPQTFAEGSELTVNIAYTMNGTNYTKAVKLPAGSWDAGKKYAYLLEIYPTDIRLTFVVQPWDVGEAGEIDTENGSINMSNVTWMNTKVKLTESATSTVNTVNNSNYSVNMYYKPWVSKTVDEVETWSQYDGYYPAQGYFTVNYPVSGLFKIELIPAYGETTVSPEFYEILIYDNSTNPAAFRAIDPDGEEITNNTVYFRIAAAAEQDGAEHKAQINIWFKPALPEDAPEGAVSEWISAYSEVRANYALVIPATD